MKAETPRRPLSKEEEKSADSLRAIYMKNKKRLGLTQEELGVRYSQKFGGPIVSQGAISHYFKKKQRQPLNVRVAIFFADQLEVNVEEFAPRWILDDIKRLTASEESMTRDYFQISYYKKKLAAGSGSDDPDSRAEKILFRYSWAEENQLQVGELIAVGVKGHSMEPQILDGDTVIVRRDITKLDDGDVYAFNQGDDQRIKRVYRKKKDFILLVSDNPEPSTGPELIRRSDLSDITVIGKVVWRLGKVR